MEYTFINLSTLSISCSGLLLFQHQRSRFHQFLLFRRLKVGQTAHAAFSLIVNLQTVAPDVQLHRFKCFNTEFKKKNQKKKTNPKNTKTKHQRWNHVKCLTTQSNFGLLPMIERSFSKYRGDTHGLN